MELIILATLEHDGAIWTACLEPAGSNSTSVSLHFVRDWLIGGTRRTSMPVDTELFALLSEGTTSAIETRLRYELARTVSLDHGGLSADIEIRPRLELNPSAPDRR